MTLKLSEKFNDIRQRFIDSVTNGEDITVQNENYAAMIDSLFEEAKKEARQEVRELIAQTPAEAELTVAERKFFNEFDKTKSEGIEELIPQETVDRIFDDMVKEHPLLEEIGLRNNGLRLKFLSSETKGVAVWGNMFDGIKSQLQAKFGKQEAIQHKLTAFVAIPKDAVEYGPAWLKSFVALQINEAFSVALEAGFLSGNGSNCPIGLNRKLTGTTEDGVTTYPKKEAQATKITFASAEKVVDEVTEIFKYHSVKADGKTSVKTDGNVVIVANPAEIWDIRSQYTSLNAMGSFVTALPYGLIIIPSFAQTKGEVTSFVKGRYDAVVGGGIKIAYYKETLALDDMDLYTSKHFAYGKSHDERTSAVWQLNMDKVLPGG
ncbi:Phage capsid family protein [Streptococcus varani]|uniref:Phage capsid family protein n=1 Tax=Streptococcus varani TaxID=1608583 RepID=A0A0E4H4E5_9STRE|nr:phage major capsid protein [Streptococcus varani]CQR24584.1 Phage capsid family protein [Streptococcus varani]